jgi:hypothetical protein
LQGELGKIKPPTFNGDHRKREETEAWTVGNEEVFLAA